MYKSIGICLVGETANWIHFGTDRESVNKVTESEMEILSQWLDGESNSLVVKCMEDDISLTKSTILFSRLKKK